MALLTLKDIGKIYVSGSTVAVGIRGVNLSFERGEFVAVTGKSGSGKSTLLNVISGMDSYEEGEMIIDGNTTSHFIEQDRELYREKYISFIFQDYNIIESYTVLENVELALMHIEDKKKRRKRAIELLTRVGMAKFLKHKGSKLSGGQKQRTVIARALAKDSPIILADEPTGNLDSATSAEIIALLREVSKDKLLIMVTHNFEQVKDIATRHIRVFDGAVESDQTFSRPEYVQNKTETEKEESAPKLKRDIKNGITLGFTIFKSKPKLSFFICLLLIISTLGMFLLTSSSGEDIKYLFKDTYMFNHIDGRLVIARQDGNVMTAEELQKLCDEMGANSFMQLDAVLDTTQALAFYSYPTGDEWGTERYVRFDCTYGKDYGNPDIGRYPETKDEVFLYAPISYQDIYGKTELLQDKLNIHGVIHKVVGVKYYYDNNIMPEALVMRDCFRVVSAHQSQYNTDISAEVIVSYGDISEVINIGWTYRISSSVEPGKVYISEKSFEAYVQELEKKLGVSADDLTIKVTVGGYRYSNNGYDVKPEYTSIDIDRSYITFVKPTSTEDARSTMQTDYYYDVMPDVDTGYYGGFIFSPEAFVEIAEELYTKIYKQASLFYDSDEEAHAAVAKLREAGYMAVPSDTTCEPEIGDMITNLLLGVLGGIMWFFGIVFLAFFVNLCTSRAIGAFKGEMAIMRSMGIRVTVIKIAMYMRMLISLIPAVIAVIAVAIGIFTSPKINAMFTYMYWWQYAIIFVGMILLVTRVTYKQIYKLFNASVKKSLKGGEEQ